MSGVVRHFLTGGVAALLLLFALVPGLTADTGYGYSDLAPPDMETIIKAREEFVYEITYGFLTLGWIEIRLLADTRYLGEKAYHLQTLVRSNSSLPLVGEKLVSFESLFRYNEDWPYTLLFWKDEIHDNEYDSLRVVFNRRRQQVDFYDLGEYTGSLELVEPATGGNILFLYSRIFAGLGEPYKLPVYTENELGYVEASNGPEVEMRSYEAFDEPVAAVRSRGVADINGPFGLNGRFSAWYSADSMRIPLEAHLNVILGKAKVRLISYQRNGEHLREPFERGQFSEPVRGPGQGSDHLAAQGPNHVRETQ